MSLSENNNTQLINAIKKDDVGAVKSLLNLADESLSEIQSDQALKIAVSNNATQSCQYLIKYEKGAPSQKARGSALINAAKSFGFTKPVSIEIVKILCEPDLHTPTQNDVSDALIAAVESSPPKWDYVDYLSSLTTENRPTQAAIGLAFQKAIENFKWGLARKLCESTGDAPDQKTVGDAIQKVVSSNIPLDTIKHFCEKSTHKACSTDVDQALLALLACEEKTFPQKWAYIDYLITMTAENKPSQKGIDKALEIMVRSNKIELVKKLCSIETDNAPSQKARGLALINAAKTSEFTPTPTVSLEIVKILCESGLYPPSQNDVSNTVIAALESRTPKWDYINYLSSLTTENRPTQAVIGLTFQKAIENFKWGLARKLCESTGDAPDQKTVGDAVQKVVSSNIPLDTIKHFCEKSTHKACSTDVDQTLLTLLTCEEKTFPKKWAYIDYLITMTAENKPSQKGIDKALEMMVRSNNEKMVKKLCSIETDNAPSQKARGLALINAAKTSAFTPTPAVSLEIVMAVCKLGLNPPTKDDVNNALQEAKKSTPPKCDYSDYLGGFIRENLSAQTHIEMSDQEESFDTTATLT